MDEEKDNSSYCFNFTDTDLKINIGVTVSLHLLAILTCLAAILFIFATKQHKVFVNRLVLYLMVVSSLWSLTIMAEVIPVSHESSRQAAGVRVRQGWDAACAAMGFISQLVESAKILVVCWIVLYLLLLVVFKHNISKPSHEVVGLVVVMALPPLVDWIPFRWGSYGLSGLWCWIELTDRDCQDFRRGLGLMLGIEYIPVLLAVMFTAVSFISIMVALCRRAHRADIKWKWASIYQKGLAETGALMVYPAIYGVIFIFRVIHRTYYVVQIKRMRSPNYTLWLAHSTALGIGAILVPLLYLLRPSNLRKFYFCRRFLLRREVPPPVVYRSSSLISTEGLSVSEGEVFTDGGFRDSSLLYRSIMSSQK